MENQNFYLRLHGYYKNLVPLFEKPKVGAYTMLILSFLTVAFFSAFAIRPALDEIGHLKKEISDKQKINESLGQKINNLRAADLEYQKLKPELAIIFTSLPDAPQAANLVGKFNRALIENNVDVQILEFTSLVLHSPDEAASSSASVVHFTLTGKASYENILRFITLISHIDRIITIDSVDVSVDDQLLGQQGLLTATIKGKSYMLSEGKNE